jgi:RimJ/RimL family protein N-acetyltransferase
VSAGVAGLRPPLPLPDPPLHDAAVRLRPWRAEEAAWIALACQDPEVPRFTQVPSPYEERDAMLFLAALPARRAAGIELALAVADAATDAPLGAIGLRPVDGRADVAEIGYWTAREARGRGLTTRAVRLLAGWALHALPLGRLEIHVAPDNAPSRRVAERAGFALTDRRRARAGEPLLVYERP